MIPNFFYFFYFFLIILSSIGFGFLIQNQSNIKTNEFYNIGSFGISGLFILNIVSYSLSLIDRINPIVNICIILIGIFIFFFYVKNDTIKKKNIYLLFIFLIYLGILIGKPHDDFHYYHFPYIHYLLNSDFIYGVGHLNHGFRTPSSIFYLNSVFYNQFTGYGTFHFGAALYFLFANIYLFEKIQFLLKNKKQNLAIFAICIFVFINIFFYRIGEHGTDRSAQILSLIFIFEIFIFLNIKNNIENRIKILIILLGIIISLKAFYILFVIFSFVVIHHLYTDQKRKVKEIYKLVFLNLVFCLFLIKFINIITINMINTGCLIYPVYLSCFDNLSWSLGSLEAIKMNNWYELWSKGGATPNMRVSNPDHYLTNFNWVINWFNIYFFTKVSDFLLGIIFLSLVIFITLRLKLNFSNYRFKILLLFVFILLFEWFYNHPALRYGGYSLISSIFFILLSSLCFKKNKSIKKFSKNISYLIIFSLCIFFIRNVDRIVKEKNLYNYMPFKNPYYDFGIHDYRILKKINLLKEEIQCSDIKKECNDKEFEINFLNNNKFFISKKNND